MVADDCLLVFGQHPDTIPFSVKRIFYILKPRKGLPRGFHTHHKTKQVIFCIQGQFRLTLDDGKTREEAVLSKANKGVYLAPMIWHEMADMDKRTIILVVASRKYDPNDYIRDYQKFLRLVNDGKKRSQV